MNKAEARIYDETVARSGFRLTDQRRQVYDVLMAKRDHPTAVEVFMRAKHAMPSISLATVYNCLEALTECGLVKQVHIDRGASRYCANLEKHGHFLCESCGAVTDVPLKNRKQTWNLPPNAVISNHEVSLRGLCPECAKKQNKKQS
jgi:Fur family peroxide stress response transcriptional regulator